MYPITGALQPPWFPPKHLMSACYCYKWCQLNSVIYGIFIYLFIFISLAGFTLSRNQCTCTLFVPNACNFQIMRCI